MGLFTMDADVEQQEEKDTLGGFKIYESGLVGFTIKTAFLDDYAGGSKNITIILEDETGATYTEKECVWSAKTKGPTYIDKKTGKKKALIGFSKIDSLAKLLTGKGLSESVYETKVHELYSKEASAKVPTPRPTLVDWADMQVTAGILKTVKNKQVKSGDSYVDTAETRDENSVDKWFDADRKTLTEKMKGEEAVFIDQWEKANTGRVIDKVNKSVKSGPVAGAASATAPALKFSQALSQRKEWVISSPLFIPKNKRGDKWYLNLNNYRNTHYQTSNKVKQNYKEHICSLVQALPVFEKVSISFHIHACNKRKFDIDNIASIHAKFFLDALTELGKLPDDNYDYVPETHTYFAGIDKANPRVDITIKEITDVQY